MRRSGKVGVLFRVDGESLSPPPQSTAGRTASRIAVRKTASPSTSRARSRGWSISGNEIVETRGPQRRIGIRVGAKARDIRLADNRIRGCATEVADLRKR